MSRPIVFLSDYGLDDEFVGTCHGVIARIAPHSRIIDLTHSLPRQDVMRGAVLLADSVAYMPEDAVFMAVVDPGVGTARRPLAVRTAAGQLLVGPDNGLLSMAWGQLGGLARAVHVTSAKVIAPNVSATFHGRDIFAPAAAHLACGVPLEELGPDVEPDSVATVTLPEPKMRDGEVRCQVMGVDRFGNLQLGIRPGQLHEWNMDRSPDLEVRTARQSTRIRRASTFGEVGEGEFAAIVDSRGWLAVVLNRGNAAAGLGLSVGDLVFIREPAEMG
jgi:S-adenosylmethionine hydrolase